MCFLPGSKPFLPFENLPCWECVQPFSLHYPGQRCWFPLSCHWFCLPPTWQAKCHPGMVSHSICITTSNSTGPTPPIPSSRICYTGRSPPSQCTSEIYANCVLALDLHGLPHALSESTAHGSNSLMTQSRPFQSNWHPHVTDSFTFCSFVPSHGHTSLQFHVH